MQCPSRIGARVSGSWGLSSQKPDLAPPWLHRNLPLSPQSGGEGHMCLCSVADPAALLRACHSWSLVLTANAPSPVVQLIFVPATNSSFFVISHHVPVFRFLMYSFLRHHVLIPSSYLGPSAKNSSVPAGRYYLA